MDWLDLLAVQGTLKSLFQHHSSKASILQHSAFFTVQLSHPYMTTGKTIALTRWTFVGKVMVPTKNSDAATQWRQGRLSGTQGSTDSLSLVTSISSDNNEKAIVATAVC